MNHLQPKYSKLFFITLSLCVLSSCSTVKGLFSGTDDSQVAIDNPFVNYQAPSQPQSFSLKSSRGEKSMEVRVPSEGNYDQVVMPFYNQNSSNSPSSNSEVDETYRNRKASSVDYEILSQLPKASPEDLARQKEIEKGLGLQSAEIAEGVYEQSYLGALDKVKQLYKQGRYEAALLEVEDQLKLFPYHAKLYEMRGTLLDRTGFADLAMKSWKQALKFDPKNFSLKKFIDQREQSRGIASETNSSQSGVNP